MHGTILNDVDVCSVCRVEQFDLWIGISILILIYFRIILCSALLNCITEAIQI